MAPTLNARKQQFVRNTIWDSAIDLFAEKGFDETTVDDIAKAAGVSRRSFFRYFASKNDLMAQAIVNYGTILTTAINGCPRTFSLSEVLRETVLQVARQAAEHPRTPKIIQIASKYPTAREAQMSRIAEVQDVVAEAFARRSKHSGGHLKQRILARLTMSLIDVTLQSWFEDGQQDISATVKQALTTLSDVVCKVSTR